MIGMPISAIVLPTGRGVGKAFERMSATRVSPAPVSITAAPAGRIYDPGVTDSANMGAAMAQSAYETLRTFFRDSGQQPADFDLIVTGDLAAIGRDIVIELFRRDGVELDGRYQDCGMLLYDESQDAHAGASGCGCSASVLNGYLLTEMRRGRWDRILFAPTGALLSPTSSFQGESIPGICHVVCISTEK